MPTFTRLIFIAALLICLIYGIMWGLVVYVRPTTVELSVEIPQAEIKLRPWPD